MTIQCRECNAMDVQCREYTIKNICETGDLMMTTFTTLQCECGWISLDTPMPESSSPALYIADW